MTKATGIDISFWQGQPNWQQVQTAGLSFCFIKTSEGAGYQADYQSQWDGAGSIGLLRGAYHFHRATANGALQADYFMNWAPKVYELPPVIDFEDGEALRMTDITGAQVFENLKACLARLESKWGILPMVYTGLWFLQGCLAESPDYDATWLKKYPLWIADYTKGTPDSEPDRPAWWPWKFYQWTSSGTVNGIAVRTDMNVFNGTVEELKAWAKVKEVPGMIYNSAVQPINRGRLWKISSDDAKTKVDPQTKTVADPGAAGMNAMIIRCGGTDGAGFKTYQDVAWDARLTYFRSKSIPVVAWFAHDPAWYFGNEVDADMLRIRNVEQDPTMMQLLRCLHTNPNVSWQGIVNSTKADWRVINAVMISQFNAQYKVAGDIGDFWFQLSIANLINRLKVLMDGGIVPAVPIIFQTSDDLIAKFTAQTKEWLEYAGDGAKVPARASWLWLSYKHWLLAEAHSDIPTLADCWQWAVYNLTSTFAFASIPNGYEKRIVFFETTGKRLYVPLYTESDGVTDRPVTLAVSNDTPEVLEDMLAIDGGGTEPPIDPDIEKRLAALESLVAAQALTIAEQQVAIDQLETWQEKIREA